MEEGPIVWEYPDSLDEPYKTWAEDFIRNYVHKGIRPKYKDFDRISNLFARLGTIDRDADPKYYNMNKLALEDDLGEFEFWLNKGEKVAAKKLASGAQFKAQDLLPKFDLYLIDNVRGRKDTDLLFKMMDLSGNYWGAEYPIGTLIFKNNEEGPGLEFNSIIMEHRLKAYPLEGFEAKEIGIGSHLAYNSDKSGKPEIYFLPGTNGQVLNAEKGEIII